jgi:mannose-6-phosphate isomerase-like protein (cupin superfamily)
MQLDDEFISLQPGRCILIPPGVRHRAIGQMKVLIFVIPKFDPEDEFLADHWASSDPATAPS